MNYDNIFSEYYALFRGQATNIPKSTDAEYLLGIPLANNAIRKWDRVDGQLWNELWETAQEDGSGDLDIDVTSTDYDAPDNMRKPPAFVFIVDANGNRTPIKVIDPHAAEDYTSGSLRAYFTGSANSKYVMHFTSLPSSYDGYIIDYPYLKKPTMITDGNSVPDMSDPNFIIQDMLSSRFANARNGFGYKTAKAEAQASLLNMKIENNTGTYGNSSNLGDDGIGFGAQRADII